MDEESPADEQQQQGESGPSEAVKVDQPSTEEKAHSFHLLYSPINKIEMETVKASKNLPLAQAILLATKDYPFLQSA